MTEIYYRWVMASERLPTHQDYLNTCGIIYKNYLGYPSIKQARANFSVNTIKAGRLFYMWLEKVQLSEPKVE